MKVTLLLCDHAQVADGKLFISGAGWSVCPAPAPPHAVAALISVPWDRTNIPHQHRLELLDEDGNPVKQPGPSGEVAVEATGTFEVGRPAGMRHGGSISVPLAVNVRSLPLRPDTGYEWRLTIDNQSNGWSVSFRTGVKPT